MPGRAFLAPTGFSTRRCSSLGLIDAPVSALVYSVNGVVITLTYFLLPFAVLPIYGSLRSIEDATLKRRAIWRCHGRSCAMVASPEPHRASTGHGLAPRSRAASSVASSIDAGCHRWAARRKAKEIGQRDDNAVDAVEEGAHRLRRSDRAPSSALLRTPSVPRMLFQA